MPAPVYVPFPITAFNINVVGTGAGGHNTHNVIESLGTMPPATGMPVFTSPNRPNVTGVAQLFINGIFDNGTILVTPSGITEANYATSGSPYVDQLFFRQNPNDIYILVSDATTFGWPTASGIGSIVDGYSALQSNAFTLPTGVVRGVHLIGSGFIYG